MASTVRYYTAVCCTMYLVATVLASKVENQNAERPPNVVLFLLDDTGLGDLGCYGNKSVKTPNIDKLAKEGMKFNRMYANPYCSPSRAAILTGRLPPRTGILKGRLMQWQVFVSSATNGGLQHDELTMAEVFKEKGYDTRLLGKWHIGNGPGGKYLPMRHGFDYWVLDEVRHLLNCPVCYQQYEHPRRLSCEHVFCSPCLKKLLYEGVIKCPECRLQTTLLPPTINSLPSCIIIQRFIEGLSKNNNICDNDKCLSNTSNGNLNGELVENVERPNDRKLDKLKNSIRLKYQPTIDHLKEKKRSIEDNLNSVRNSINYFTHELTKEIQTRRSQLMEEVTCYERRWLKPLECQIDGLEMEVHEQISFALFQEDVFSKTGELISEVDTRSPVDLPDVRDAFECGRLSLSDTGMLQQLREQISLLGTINEDRNQNYMPSISSAPRDDFAKEITSVFNNQSNLPCNFGPQGMCVERNGVLMVVDSWNRMCHEVTPTNLIRSFSLTDDDGDRSSANLYDVTSIDHGRKLIFSNISSPILKTFDHTFNKTTSIDLHIPSSFQLQPSPFGLARDRRDYIYVADKRNRVIQVREQSGKLVRQFPCNGIPRYIDVWNDILVVSDSGNKCCYIYSVDGRLLSTIDQKSGVHFEMPMGVAFHEKGFIFAADYLKKCVCAFRISGQLCFEVDLSGYKINPEGITVHRNTVYISDRLNSTVIKINLTEFLTI